MPSLGGFGPAALGPPPPFDPFAFAFAAVALALAFDFGEPLLWKDLLAKGLDALALADPRRATGDCGVRAFFWPLGGGDMALFFDVGDLKSSSSLGVSDSSEFMSSIIVTPLQVATHGHHSTESKTPT